MHRVTDATVRARRFDVAAGARLLGGVGVVTAPCAAPPGGTADRGEPAWTTVPSGRIRVPSRTVILRMRILFVCMGNICRSPTAEGVFRRLVEERAPWLGVEIDSAGTHDYHVGEAPDSRAVAAAARRGIDLSGLRARQVDEQDFERFDLILAMDRLNREVLLDRAPAVARERIRLFMEYAGEPEAMDVPDPYYGGPLGFEHVLDLAEEAAAGLLERVLSAQQQARGRRR